MLRGSLENMALAIVAQRKLSKDAMTGQSKIAGLSGVVVDHAHQVHPRQRVVVGHSKSHPLCQNRSAVEPQDHWDRAVVAAPGWWEVRVWGWINLDLRRLLVP